MRAIIFGRSLDLQLIRLRFLTALCKTCCVAFEALGEAKKQGVDVGVLYQYQYHVHHLHEHDGVTVRL